MVTIILPINNTGGASGSYDILLQNDPNTVFNNIMKLDILFPSSYYNVAQGTSLTVTGSLGFTSGATILATVPTLNKVSVDFTNKKASQTQFAFRLIGVTNSIYETTPMILTISFYNGAGTN